MLQGRGAVTRRATDGLAASHQVGARTDGSEAATYWDIDDVQFHCRVSRSTAWRLVRSDGFPPPAVFGRRVVWPRAEVVIFMEDRRVPNYYADRDQRAGVTDGRAPAFTSRQVRRRVS